MEWAAGQLAAFVLLRRKMKVALAIYAINMVSYLHEEVIRI